MERRKAIITAAAASLTLLAGGAGMVLNSGIVGASGGDKVGTLTPVTTGATPPVTVYVDPATAATTVTPAAPAIQPATTAPVTVSSASAVSERRDGDSSEERDDGEHRSYYEGAGDDD